MPQKKIKKRVELRVNEIKTDFMYEHTEKPNKKLERKPTTDIEMLRKKSYPFGYPKMKTEKIEPKRGKFLSYRKDPFYKVAHPIKKSTLFTDLES